MKLDDLPTEILDLVFLYINSKDYVNFLLVNSRIYSKCQKNIFKFLSVRLYYPTGLTSGFKCYKQLRATEQLLEQLHKKQFLAESIRSIEIRNDNKLFTKPNEGPYFYFKRYDRLSMAIIDELPLLCGVRMLYCEISKGQLLDLLVQGFHNNLKTLIINITSCTILDSLENNVIVKTRHKLKFLKIIYTGSKPLNFRPIKIRYIRRAIGQLRDENGEGWFSENSINETLIENIKQERKGTLKKLLCREEAKIKCLGQKLAQIVASSSKTLFTIEVVGMDASIIFQHPDTNIYMENLRIIRLCERSIQKLNLWLRDLELLNFNRRPTLKPDSGKEECLPPVVTIFSNIFQHYPSLDPSDKRYICLLKCFSRSQGHWISLDGAAKDFWRRYYYF